MARLLSIDTGSPRESRAQKQLAGALPDGWIVTTNVHERRFEVIRKRTELDSILICPYGIYVIDFKHIQGVVTPKLGGEWGGLDRENPFDQGRDQLFALKNLIRHHTSVEVFVDQLVVLSHDASRIDWTGSDVPERTESRLRVTKIHGVEDAVQNLSKFKIRIDPEDARKIVSSLTSQVPDDLFKSWSSYRPRSREARISLTEEQASTGAKVKVSIEGHTFELATPPGLTDGTKIRLRNALNGSDVYVLVSVKSAGARKEPGASRRKVSRTETKSSRFRWTVAAGVAVLFVLWFFVSQISTTQNVNQYAGSDKQAEAERAARQQQAEQERRRQEQLRQEVARQREAEEQQVWNEATRVVNARALSQYLAQFPNGQFAAEARRRLDVLKSVTDEFDIRSNMEIIANSSYNTQVFIGSGGGSGVVKCALFCARNANCQAFTSDDNSCRIYSSVGVATTSHPGWSLGFRRAATDSDGHGPYESYWTMSDSQMGLVRQGTQLRFYYVNPRQGMREVNVRPGTLYMTGKLDGGTFGGTAYTFSIICGALGYEVSGWGNDSSVTVSGDAPMVDSSCTIRQFEQRTSILQRQ